ncbi:hypothetical protein ACY2DA_10710 [Staphylococcus simulans]
MKNKILIALVEGDTDEALINVLVEKFERNIDFQVHIVRCDLFAEYTRKSIKQNVGDWIKKEVLNKYKLKKKDIIAIIQVIDIDAVFISEVRTNDQIDRVLYYSNRIEVPNEKRKDEIIDRNKNKSGKINQMITTKVLSDIEYRLFFFSCNLEHAIFNQFNVMQEEKDDLIFEYIDCTTIEEIERHLEKIALQKSTKNFVSDFRNSWQTMKDSKVNVRNTNVNLLNDYINFIIASH